MLTLRQRRSSKDISKLLPRDYYNASGWSETSISMTEGALNDIEKFCKKLKRATGHSPKRGVAQDLLQIFQDETLHPAQMAQAVLAIRDQLYDDLIGSKRDKWAGRREKIRVAGLVFSPIVTTLAVIWLSVGSWTEVVALASWISSLLNQAGTELWAQLPTLDEAVVGTAEAANRLIDDGIWLKAWFERQDDQVQVLFWIMLGCFGLVAVAGIASRTR